MKPGPATTTKRLDPTSSTRRRAKVPLAGIAIAAVAILAVAIFAVSRLWPGEPTIPADPKARSEFVAARSSKLSQEERRLLARFLDRVQEQENAGGSAPKVTLAGAIQRQRTYDQEVAEVQKRVQERLDAARAALGVTVRDQAIVKSQPGQSSSGKSLRYVMEIANRDKRTVDAMDLRVEFRDPSRKYIAAIPTLQLKGPLAAGETGRSVQLFPLDAKQHQYIVDGGGVQISAYPTLIAYADGETLDAEKELKLLESMAQAKIE